MKIIVHAARLALFSLFVALTALAASSMRPECAAASDEKEIELKTKITAATVYSNQVQVVRAGSVDLKTGLHKLVCSDLPGAFTESSLQVEGRGTAQARIMGVDIVKVRGLAAESPRYKELKEKLEKLTARRDSLQIELGSLASSVQFLDNYAAFPFEKGGAKLAPEIFRVQDWKGVIEFIASERTKTNERIDGLKKRGAKLTEEINWINAQLNEMQTKGDWSRRVVVDCEIASPGSLELSFTYNVHGAGWSPEYLIRYDTAKESIDLSYNARLWQSTGEDWKDVAVTLSTARPQVGAAPPEITPLYLQRVVRPRPDELHVRGGRSKEVQAELDRAAPPAAAESAEDKMQEYEAERPGAEVASSEFAASFAVPQAVDLASGRDPRRVLILQGTLTGTLSRYASPRFSQNVFVTGDVTNTLEAPILAGPADIYIESAPAGARGKTSNFVGKEFLKAVATGQGFPVHLGIDQDIKVTYKLEKKEYLTKDGAPVRKIRFHYLATLESFKKGAVDIKLQDRVPVTAMKEIKVTNVDIEPKPSEERDDGILTWNLAPAPKQKMEIRIAYTIELPGDWDERSLNLE